VTLAPSRGMLLASAVALLMHLLLFAVARPSEGLERQQVLVVPKTFYGEQSPRQNETGDMVRRVKSPVIFSLPSPMGFSRSLTENDVQTRKMFMQQPIRSEHFLETEAYTQNPADRIQPERLMVSAAHRDPGLPVAEVSESTSFPSFRRVTMSPILRERLIGGIVLPAEMNKTFDKPWTVHAWISISDQGAVEHVFLDQPIEPASLNQEIIHLLFSLRFKPGRAINGDIDVFSPESVVNTGGVL